MTIEKRTLNIEQQYLPNSMQLNKTFIIWDLYFKKIELVIKKASLKSLTIIEERSGIILC